MLAVVSPFFNTGVGDYVTVFFGPFVDDSLFEAFEVLGGNLSGNGLWRYGFFGEKVPFVSGLPLEDEGNKTPFNANGLFEDNGIGEIVGTSLAIPCRVDVWRRLPQQGRRYIGFALDCLTATGGASFFGTLRVVVRPPRTARIVQMQVGGGRGVDVIGGVGGVGPGFGKKAGGRSGEDREGRELPRTRR